MTDHTQRFSDRVEDYIKYRPSYPDEVVQLLEKKLNLIPGKIIADIGSGTGIASFLFLKKDYTVIGVEPNKEMREAAEKLLSNYANFQSINGSAENTHLPAKSVDLILCAQAFHWFDKEKSKVEFHRILKEDGNIVLVWNSRTDKSDFQIDYEKALNDHLEEYKFVNHRNITDEEIASFFAPKEMHKVCIDNKQVLDLEGLKGRLRSSSYCPKSGETHDKLMKNIDQIFDDHQENNHIEFVLETQIYFGSY